MRRSQRPKLHGLFTDESAAGGCWLRDRGWFEWPSLEGVRSLTIEGELLPAPAGDSTAIGRLGLAAAAPGGATRRTGTLPVGRFELEVELPLGANRVDVRIEGVAASNFRAWLGRITGLAWCQPWRRQARNRRLRLLRVRSGDDVLFDFSRRDAPWNGVWWRRQLRVGLNVLGYLRADLGVGESARCMVRAADADRLPAALVELRLPCKNPAGDDALSARLQDAFPQPVTVVHVDPPGMRDLDHHHGDAYRRDRHVVGYWAWELPEFPDAWVDCADRCDEIWAPSRFTAEAIAEKVGVPVLVMPHAIAFARPTGDLRPKFGLPADRFLFLFLCDLNSYAARKNPGAVLEAFRRSGLAGRGAALVIKVHNVRGHEAEFDRLQAEAAALPGTTVIGRTLKRHEVYELEAACDCFVSLHRSEGFGLAVAESMYLGKPVISTDWSATAEFVNAENGCPVRAPLVTLERDYGPYSRGQVWAEPDLDHAADWMRRLAGDPELAARLGAAGLRTVEERFAPAVIGARYRRRLVAIVGR